MTGLRYATPSDRRETAFSRAGEKAKGVGVEVQLQGQHGLEDEIGGHVAQAIASFRYFAAVVHSGISDR